MYPIKVNQHYGVAGVLAQRPANEQFGLEAGSKPELMAVLGLAKPGSVIVCNGYKDREFIHLALLGKQLGFDTTFIVVEKPSELDMILQEAAKPRRHAGHRCAAAAVHARRRQMAELRRR